MKSIFLHQRAHQHSSLPLICIRVFTYSYIGNSGKRLSNAECYITCKNKSKSEHTKIKTKGFFYYVKNNLCLHGVELFF